MRRPFHGSRRYAFTETFRLLMGFALGAASPFIGLTIAAGLMAMREGVWLAGAAQRRRDRRGAPESLAWLRRSGGGQSAGDGCI
jgi:hypothetical protein